MKGTLPILLVAAWLAGCADTPTDAPAQLTVTDNGNDQYTFEDNPYNYGNLVMAIRSEYGDQHIGTIQVTLAGAATVGDMPKLCRLKRDTGAMVTATYLDANGQPATLYCN